VELVSSQTYEVPGLVEAGVLVRIDPITANGGLDGLGSKRFEDARECVREMVVNRGPGTAGDSRDVFDFQVGASADGHDVSNGRQDALSALGTFTGATSRPAVACSRRNR
jgi:hypothetical protein